MGISPLFLTLFLLLVSFKLCFFLVLQTGMYSLFISYSDFFPLRLRGPSSAPPFPFLFWLHGPTFQILRNALQNIMHSALPSTFPYERVATLVNGRSVDPYLTLTLPIISF